METGNSAAPERRQDERSLSSGLAVLALLLPPLAVFLAQGLSRDFWICFGLTCLGYVPGLIFAIFLLLKSRRPAAGAA